MIQQRALPAHHPGSGRGRRAYNDDNGKHTGGLHACDPLQRGQDVDAQAADACAEPVHKLSRRRTCVSHSGGLVPPVLLDPQRSENRVQPGGQRHQAHADAVGLDTHLVDLPARVHDVPKRHETRGGLHLETGPKLDNHTSQGVHGQHKRAPGYIAPIPCFKPIYTRIVSVLRT